MVDGVRIAIAGGVTFVIVALLVPVARRYALRNGITDNPAPGKSHASPTPYLGGVAIALGAVACSAVLPEWQSQAAVILAAAALVAVTGLFDDVRTVRPSMRLLVEASAATAAAAAGAHVQLFGGPLDYVITVVWIVVITNSFNLLDNMDAAAGSIATVIASALAVTALLEGQRLVGGMAVVVAAACLAFLLYNWHPARIFMGDAGSLFLGFVLAVIALEAADAGAARGEHRRRGPARRPGGLRHDAGGDLPGVARAPDLHRRHRPHLAPPPAPRHPPGRRDRGAHRRHCGVVHPRCPGGRGRHVAWVAVPVALVPALAALTLPAPHGRLQRRRAGSPPARGPPVSHPPPRAAGAAPAPRRAPLHPGPGAPRRSGRPQQHSRRS